MVEQEEREEEVEPGPYRKDNTAVVYGKQDYMWQVRRRKELKGAVTNDSAIQ